MDVSTPQQWMVIVDETRAVMVLRVFARAKSI
jgi:hypothetical protein